MWESPEMKVRAAHLFLVGILAAMAAVVSGCTSDPEKLPVCPWDTPEGYQNGALGDLMDQQHR